ncbi:MAG TPA: creatininase family protein, partial [Spirochaetia bacterium]|nr:creatininase family protein [Spirochaetia bacterium]
MIAEHFCREIDARIGHDVLILPTVSIACSRHHLDFGGTLTVRHETFIEYIKEILDSVAAQGFRNLVLFNSHGGNQAAGNVVVESWGMSNPECRIAMLTWWRTASASLLEITETGPGGIGHAGEFETSLMMLIAPELVRSEEIAKGGNIPTFSWAESDMIRGAGGLFHRSTRKMTSNGAFGDPTAASVEKGRRITEAVITELQKMLGDLRSAPLD